MLSSLAARKLCAQHQNSHPHQWQEQGSALTQAELHSLPAVGQSTSLPTANLAGCRSTHAAYRTPLGPFHHSGAAPLSGRRMDSSTTTSSIPGTSSELPACSSASKLLPVCQVPSQDMHCRH